MNSLEALNLVEKAFCSSGAIPGLQYELWFAGDGFHCDQYDPKNPKVVSIGVYSGCTICKGLTVKQWNSLQMRIEYLQQKGKLCLKSPTH